MSSTSRITMLRQDAVAGDLMATPVGPIVLRASLRGRGSRLIKALSTMKHAGTLAIAALCAGAPTAAVAAGEEMPRLQRNGQATQLMVAGEPYLVLGGELHNSSPSSPAYMAPIWPRLKKGGVRTVIGVASWELVEPVEGKFDFSAVDDQILKARANGMRIVLIWFGAYKNAASTYAPSWVRRDETRFPRGQRDPDSAVRGNYASAAPILSVFGKPLVQADQRAFGALMAHLRAVDSARTVVMVQVENEVGLLGDSRDRSSLADAAWREKVPTELTDYLLAHQKDLRPVVGGAWARQGSRRQGTWSEVFGTDRTAEEIFMAWGFARYIEQVARVGAAQYPLPMYTNAWLGPQPGAAEPGQYPSGGPVGQMMDVWKAAAPSLALLAPDIYVDDFAGTLADFNRPNNPIFVPEARLDAGNLFVALGEHAAIGFAPFSIEDAKEDDDVLAAYRVLGGMDRLITTAQAAGRIRGFKLGRGDERLKIGGYTFTISRPRSSFGAFGPETGEAAARAPDGYGMILQTADDTFVVVGRGITFDVSAPGSQVEIDTADEGRFEANRWVPLRRLNGDERRSLVPAGELGVVQIRMLRRP